MDPLRLRQPGEVRSARGSLEVLKSSGSFEAAASFLLIFPLDLGKNALCMCIFSHFDPLHAPAFANLGARVAAVTVA